MKTEIKDRLKQIRQKEGFSQKDFAESIKLKQQSYAQYETGRVIPPDIVIDMICTKYNVNENWLRTGEGPQDKEMTEREKKIKQLEKALNNKSDSLLHSLMCVVDMEPDELRVLLDNGLKIHEFYMEKEFKKKVNEKNVTK